MSTPAAPTIGIEPNAGSDPIVDPPLDPSLEPDGGEPSDPDLAPKPDGEEVIPEPGTEGEQPREDGRVIPQWMKELQKSNPDAYKKAKADLFEMRDRRTVHPTVQAAREEHDLVESLGGAEGANQLREDATFFKDAANQFLKGDPAFVDDLWTEDKLAAALHVQPMLDAFKKYDMEGYKATTAKQWANEFNATGFTPALDDLLQLIQRKDFDGALKIANSFKGWHDQILNVAQRAEDPRVKSLLAERASQHEKREQTEHQEFLKSYRTEASNSVVDSAAKVFDSFFKGRKLSADDRTDLLRESLSLANRAVEADKDFAAQRDKHLERGDSKAALRLTKARFDREMSEAVKRVARRYGMVSGTAPKVPNTQQPPNGQPKPKVEVGWVAVNERPQAEHIDRSRTPNDMILSGKAILKDGRKVDWSALKKKAVA